MNLIAVGMLEGMDKHERRIAPLRELLRTAREAGEGVEDAAYAIFEGDAEIRRDFSR